MKHGLNIKCNQSIQHYIANLRNSNKYNDSALMVLTPLDTKETQDICAKSGFMHPSYYIRTGETNVCETYSTLYIIYRTYSISLKKMIISCIGSPCLHIQCFLLLLGAGYPTLTPVEGEVRFFHALAPAGPFAKRHEQQYFQHTEKYRNDITARQKHSNCTSFCSST